MDYLQCEYGYVSELGQFLIPRSMQKESDINVSPQGYVTLVTCVVENDHISLEHHSIVSLEDHKKMKESKPKEMRAIDEMGRVILPKAQRDRLQISPDSIIASYLLQDGTIKIKPVTTLVTIAS